jgi:hypothetical protein
MYQGAFPGPPEDLGASLVHVDQNERFWLLGLPITVTVGAVVDSRSLRAWSVCPTSGPIGAARGSDADFTLGNFGGRLAGGSPTFCPQLAIFFLPTRNTGP